MNRIYENEIKEINKQISIVKGLTDINKYLKINLLVSL